MKKAAKSRKNPRREDSETDNAKKAEVLARPVNQTKPPRTGMEPV